jgi:hypothetical protein
MIDDIVRPVMGGKFPPGVSVGFHGPVPTENEIQIPNDSLEASVQDALLLAHVKGVYFDREPTVAENTIEFIVAANPQSGPNP